MKRISINLYSIDELNREAQELVFENYPHFNVECGAWYDCEYYHFTEIAKAVGVDMHEDGIYFSGFYSQGSGSTFKSRIDAEKFIEGIKQKKWKEEAPTLEFDFAPCPCDKRVIALIINGTIDCSWHTDIPNRGYWLDFTLDYYWSSEYNRDILNIESELEKLDDWVKEILNSFNRHLYKLLEQEYEYQTSSEALKQTFAVSEYLFTEDGRMADRLLNLNIETV